MRDFRDAKTMAHTLRDALKGKSVETTHSESLELIAKAFGYHNWNILAAKIEAAEPRGVSPAATDDPGAPRTLYCSFCNKSQHDVRKLIAGPAVHICDKCVELCTDIIREEDSVWKVLSLLTAGDQSGNDALEAALEHVRSRSTEEVATCVRQSRQGIEKIRFVLNSIRQRLAMRDGEAPAKDAAPDQLTDLNTKSRLELLALEQEKQLLLKRYEDALQIGTTVLAERGQQRGSPS
jgi:hypothetical protein